MQRGSAGYCRPRRRCLSCCCRHHSGTSSSGCCCCRGCCCGAAVAGGGRCPAACCRSCSLARRRASKLSASTSAGWASSGRSLRYTTSLLAGEAADGDQQRAGHSRWCHCCPPPTLAGPPRNITASPNPSLTSTPPYRLVMTFCRAAACAAASFRRSRGSGFASRRSASCRVLFRRSISALRAALRTERNRGSAKKAAA